MNQIETSLEDELRYERFIRELGNLDRDQLISAAKDLAHLAFLQYPATVRWAFSEVARNFAGTWNDPKN